MRVAAQVGFDGPDSIEVQDHDDPDPGQGEAVVDVAAAVTNHHDLWLMYAPSPLVGEDDLPFVPGLDLAGTVREAPEDAAVSAGDRVVLCPNQTCGRCEFCREGPENFCERFSLFHGAFAEQAVAPADRLVPVPDSVGLAQAAALPTAYMTAYHMMRRAGVSAGDLVLVPGATGGVGVAAIQLLDAVGARSVGTSTSERKLAELEERGVDHTVHSADVEEIADAMRAIGRADAMLNHLGGEYTQLGVESVKRGGTVAICGRTADGTSEIDVQQLFLGQKEVVGSTMGTQGDLEAIVSLVADGTFEPAIGQEYAVEETAQAFHDMQEREAFGQQVIRP
jgi:NADPH2:quinone reductase